MIQQGYNRQLNEGYLEAAGHSWYDLGDAELVEAVKQIIRQGHEWPPTVPEVRQAVVGNRRTYTVSEPKYSCLACRGSGHVELINRGFVQLYPTLADAQDQFGEKWYGPAYSWWRLRRRDNENQGPLVAAALCDCDAARARRERLQDWRDNRDRWPKGKSVPAIQLVYYRERHTTRNEYEAGEESIAAANPLAAYTYPGEF